MEAITPNSSFDYVCKADRDLPKEKQSIWKIKHLSAREEAIIEDAMGEMTKGGNFAINLGSQALLALNIGLNGVENFPPSKPIKFKRDESSMVPGTNIRPWRDRDLSSIPKSARAELAKVIIDGPNLTEEESKN